MKKIIGIVIIILVLTFIGFYFYLQHGSKEVLSLNINNINLSEYNDGFYEGTYNGYRWTNSVKVEVKNHKIVSIEVTKGQQFRVKEKEEELFEEILKNQSLNVDTISGATISGKALLKAIENAFKKQ